MQAMNNLSRELDEAFEDASQHGQPPFLSSDFLTSSHPPTLTDLLVLGRFIRHGDALKPVTLEEPELIFDRVLLRCSHHYAMTRTLSKAYGFRLVPQSISNFRSFEEFNSFQTEVRYTPQFSEYRWLLKSNLKTKAQLVMLQALIDFNSSLYHDLNQMIIVRLFRFTNSKLSESEKKLYHFLLESITQMRDVDISEELKECAIPLKRLRMLYSAIPSCEPYTPLRTSVDSFRATLLSFYMQMRDGVSSYKTMPKFFKSNRKPWIDHPLSQLHATFVEEIAPNWMMGHHTELLPKKWPPPPPAYRKKIFKFKLSSPEKLVKEEKLIKDIFDWYQDLFPPAR